MRLYKGNLWDLRSTHTIAIPTNVGWTKDQANVMGRGIAAQVAKMYPALTKEYGFFCWQHQDDTPPYPYVPSTQSQSVHRNFVKKLLLVPTKPVNLAQPYLSWHGPSTLARIKQSLVQLAEMPEFHESLALPLLGCGSGQLHPEDVAPLMANHLGRDHHILCVLPVDAQRVKSILPQHTWL